METRHPPLGENCWPLACRPQKADDWDSNNISRIRGLYTNWSRRLQSSPECYLRISSLKAIGGWGSSGHSLTLFLAWRPALSTIFPTCCQLIGFSQLQSGNRTAQCWYLCPWRARMRGEDWECYRNRLVCPTQRSQFWDIKVWSRKRVYSWGSRGKKKVHL